MGDLRSKRSGFGRLARAGAVSLAVGGGMALGQASTTVTIPQGPLLPLQFGAWTPCPTGAIVATSSPLVEGRAAEVLREDGLSRSTEECYIKGSDETTIDAFQFGDATGAVSAYTYLRSPEMRVVSAGSRVGREEATSAGRYLFREGVSVVLAKEGRSGTMSTEDLRALASTLPKIGGPKGAPPLLPTLLPASHLIPESVRYAVGPQGYAAMGGTLPAGILGFDKSSEVATADYAEHGGAPGVLTLLLFPTPEIAADRGRAIETALNAAGERAGTAKLRREGPLVMLANRGFTQEEAAELVAGIHLRSEVTWNKQMAPEFHAEVRKTASLLVSIAVFSGVAGLAAVLLGLFLGFGRAWVRVLMGKPAATEPEFLRLDLRDSRGDARAGGKSAGV